VTEAAFQQLMTLITIVGTGVGTVLLQTYRENRNYRWAEKKRIDDKADATEERERVARVLAEKVTAAAAESQEERQRIARELAAKVTTEAAAVAHKVTDEATALAAKVAAEANYARARGYDIQGAIAAVGVKADAHQEAIAQVGQQAAAAFDIGNHNAERFAKVHGQISDLILKQDEAAAAAAIADKPPMKVEVVNTPLLTMVERHTK
jgi:hypothetical protein